MIIYQKTMVDQLGFNLFENVSPGCIHLLFCFFINIRSCNLFSGTFKPCALITINFSFLEVHPVCSESAIGGNVAGILWDPSISCKSFEKLRVCKK